MITLRKLIDHPSGKGNQGGVCYVIDTGDDDKYISTSPTTVARVLVKHTHISIEIPGGTIEITPDMFNQPPSQIYWANLVGHLSPTGVV